MGWFAENRDLVGIVLALAAVVVSLSTVLISRRQQQASNFVALQELLLAPDLQRARINIYELRQTGSVLPLANSPEYYDMVRAFAALDLMGLYARRRIVRQSWVMDYWHSRLPVLRAGYELMHGDQSDGYPWRVRERPDLLNLIERAESVTCRRECCEPSMRPPPRPWGPRVPSPTDSPCAGRPCSVSANTTQSNTTRCQSVAVAVPLSDRTSGR